MFQFHEIPTENDKVKKLNYSNCILIVFLHDNYDNFVYIIMYQCVIFNESV